MIKLVAIKPKQLNAKAASRAFFPVIQRTTALAYQEFEKTHSTWKHKVKFDQSVKMNTYGYIVGETGTWDKIYRYVCYGTRQHQIPKGPRWLPFHGWRKLAFRAGYNAKTSPGTIQATTGGPFGPMVVVVAPVTHPGIDPRNFEQTVMLYVKPWLIYWGKAAEKQAAKASGHG